MRGGELSAILLPHWRRLLLGIETRSFDPFEEGLCGKPSGNVLLPNDRGFPSLKLHSFSLRQALGGIDQYRQLRRGSLRAQLAQNLKAANIRHQQIQNYGVRRTLAQCSHSFGAVARFAEFNPWLI